MSATDDRGTATAERPGSLGLRVFLVSLGVLFTATLIGYFVIRLRAPAWPPVGMPSFAWRLLLSTAVIVAASVWAQAALKAARRGDTSCVRRNLVATLILGVSFLACQVVAWTQLLPDIRDMSIRLTTAIPAGRPPADPTPRQFAFLFYTLTGLHGLHVVGGLIALWLALRRAAAAFDPAALLGRVRGSVVYWHFLAVVWIVLYVALVV